MPKAPARQARVPRWANPALAFLVLMTVLFALSSRRALVGPGGGVGGPVAALQLPATRRSGGVVGSVEALRQVDWKKRGPPAAWGGGWWGGLSGSALRLGPLGLVIACER